MTCSPRFILKLWHPHLCICVLTSWSESSDRKDWVWQEKRWMSLCSAAHFTLSRALSEHSKLDYAYYTQPKLQNQNLEIHFHTEFLTFAILIHIRWSLCFIYISEYQEVKSRHYSTLQLGIKNFMIPSRILQELVQKSSDQEMSLRGAIHSQRDANLSAFVRSGSSALLNSVLFCSYVDWLSVTSQTSRVDEHCCRLRPPAVNSDRCALVFIQLPNISQSQSHC